MAILGRRRFNARLLTSIIQSAAKLKYDDDALTDKISENLLQRMDRLDADEVTDLVGLRSSSHSSYLSQAKLASKGCGHKLFKMTLANLDSSGLGNLQHRLIQK